MSTVTARRRAINCRDRHNTIVMMQVLAAGTTRSSTGEARKCMRARAYGGQRRSAAHDCAELMHHDDGLGAALVRVRAAARGLWALVDQGGVICSGRERDRASRTSPPSPPLSTDEQLVDGAAHLDDDSIYQA